MKKYTLVFDIEMAWIWLKPKQARLLRMENEQIARLQLDWSSFSAQLEIIIFVNTRRLAYVWVG